MVSLASMFAAVVVFIYSLTYALISHEYLLLIIITVIVVFIFYRHRSNISRIKNGTEPKVKWL